MSNIEWTDETWNPISGCSQISTGCKNCYAEEMTKRLSRIESTDKKYSGLLNEKGKFNGVVKFDEKALIKPLKRKKPTMYFVNSMSDLFHENVPFEWVDKIMAVIALCPQHTFQVLTKRPERMKEYFDRLQKQKPILLACEDDEDISGITFFRKELPAKYRTLPNKMIKPLSTYITPDKPENTVLLMTEPFMKIKEIEELYGKDNEYANDILEKELQATVFNLPLPNLWLGVSVENNKHLHRIDILRDMPAAVRFISFEPLLSGIENIELKNIHWVIVGGESGHNARPMHPDWVRSIRDQCKAAKVPFFFKQWGDYAPHMADIAKTKVSVSCNGIGYEMCKVGKKAAGKTLDGVEYLEYPKTNF